MCPTQPKKRRGGTGRKKISMQRIERTEYRRVTFAKRRTSLFNKARELSILCGAEVAIIAFSQTGRPYTFGHPSVDGVVKRFVHQHDMNHRASEDASAVEQQQQCSRDQNYLWDAPVDDLDLDGLEERKKKLEELRDIVRKKLDGMWLSL